MSLTRTLLRPAAYLAGRHAARQARAFLAAHQRTAETQHHVLMGLVRAHAETAFGRDHGFAAIRSYEDFARAVPVGSHETLRPYLDRVQAGEATALLPPGQRVLMFCRTSGTTGQPKHIPVGPTFLAEMRRGWNIFGSRTLRDHPAAWLRPILTISSSMNEARSPTGVPCGAISGLLAATQKRIVRRMYVAPREAAEVHDPAAKYYTILRCGVGRDVGMITTANPSSTIRLVETGQEHAERLVRDVRDGTLSPPGDVPADLLRRVRFRANPALARRLEEGIGRDGELRPGHFWNVEILCNWTGGTLKLYLRRLRELFGDVPVRDIGLLASEGRFSIPLEDGTPAGVAEITGNFLEFLPVENGPAEKGQKRFQEPFFGPARETEVGEVAKRFQEPFLPRAHELEVGAEYFLVLSNWAGLWRYGIDDRVRVVDFLGQSPVFEFLSRGRHTASITGEKITEHQVVEALRRAAADLGARIDRFTLQGRFAATPHYELRLEPADGIDPAALADRLDGELAALNLEYEAKRASGRLGPIRPVLVGPGTFEREEGDKVRRRHGRGEQYKHQYLLTDVLEA